VFAHFHTVAVKHNSSMWNWLCGLPILILCKQSAWCQRKLWACSWLCSSPVSPFRFWWVWSFRVRLMFSSPITARVLVALFSRSAQNLMLFLSRVHHEISSGRICDSKQKDIKIRTSTQLHEILYTDS
jgi:hypothetical protein